MIKLIFYNRFSNRAAFELSSGSRPWGIFLILSKGSFIMRIAGVETLMCENSIAYIPGSTYFEREVIEPISFHQLAFTVCGSHPFSGALTAGKLSVPENQVAAMLENMDVIGTLSENREQILHTIEHILALQSLYGGFVKKRSGRSLEIEYMLEYMSDHMCEAIDVYELARNVNLSYTGMLWKFKTEMSMTPMQYLIMIRLRYAKQLLLEGDLRINEIAARCGYSSAYYFSNAFRKQYGVSPTQFRNAYREHDMQEIASRDIYV